MSHRPLSAGNAGAANAPSPARVNQMLTMGLARFARVDRLSQQRLTCPQIRRDGWTTDCQKTANHVLQANGCDFRIECSSRHQSREHGSNMRRHILFAAAALMTVPGIALANGNRSVAGTDVVYSHTIFTGGEVARDSREGYLGTVFALNRDLSREGILVRLMGTYGAYEYKDFCVGCPPDPDRFNGRAWQGDVMVGYQWVRERFDAALYVGIDTVHHHISPDDPSNPVQGHETGFKVALDLESHRHNGQQHYFAMEGAYSTAFDTYFLLVRVGMSRNDNIIGIEGWLLGDETGNAQRLGAFFSRNLNLRNDLLAELTVSGGYQWVDEDGRDCGSFFGSEGAYATLNLSSFFSGERRHTPMK
jgi:hypothetical protein